MAERRDNAGTLGPNRNRKSDKHPTENGQCTIEGVDYWIAGWKRRGENGEFISLAFTRKDQGSTKARPSSPPRARATADDDDLPF